MCLDQTFFYNLTNLKWQSFNPKISFSGLEEFSSNKSKCQEHFDVYKECKKKEVWRYFSNSLYFLFMLFFLIYFSNQRALLIKFERIVSSCLHFTLLIRAWNPTILRLILSPVCGCQREARLERNRNRSLFSWNPSWSSYLTCPEQ